MPSEKKKMQKNCLFFKNVFSKLFGCFKIFLDMLDLFIMFFEFVSMFLTTIKILEANAFDIKMI